MTTRRTSTTATAALRLPPMTLLLPLLLLSALAASPAPAMPVPVPGGALLTMKVESLAERRFKNVVRQGYDLSCGAAALATLLRYYYDDPVDERRVIDAVLAGSEDAEAVRGRGFSMLELKRYGERRGYAVQGFRVEDVRKLAEAEVPMLTLITSRGYDHFVVLKGVQDGTAFLADPAFGNRAMPLHEFAKEWQGVVLVFVHPRRPARNRLALEGQAPAPAGNVHLLVDHHLQSIRPRFGEF